MLLDVYRLVSQIFAAFGGSLLAPDAPESPERRAELVACGILVGFDVPLMEISRLIGFLFETAGREIPERYREAIIRSTSAIHERWYTELFRAVGVDWEIEAWIRGKTDDLSAQAT